MTEIRINLSDWVFNAVVGREVLTLHRDYFRLRKPLERRMYELARKHCGKQDEWAISLDLLRKKCGSASSDNEFRRLVSVICDEDAEHSHMPDYAVTFDGDNVRFTNRSTMKPLPSPDQPQFPLLDPETYHDARTVAPATTSTTSSRMAELLVRERPAGTEKPGRRLHRLLPQPPSAGNPNP